MALFDNPFFRSKDNNAENEYTEGVLCIQKNDFYGANSHLKSAARGGHVSALYNLSLINGGGYISPYDVDFSIDCLRKAARGGHPKSQEFSPWIDKAEDTSFGTVALAMFAAKFAAGNVLSHILVMVGCKLYAALCAKYGVEDEVIAYELDAANHSDYQFIHNFIRRTGVSKSIYSGGLNRLEKGAAADQITDGLNQLHVGLKQSGHDDKISLMTRCTIVGYVISKSKYAKSASPLLGVDNVVVK
ncbi:hypothetical protein [Vreelandella glaciei]|uniref:hypothetical protein n=1 Tax=Vreelandella glaciei TaxID=186761 RepID=UPI0030026FD7